MEWIANDKEHAGHREKDEFTWYQWTMTKLEYQSAACGGLQTDSVEWTLGVVVRRVANCLNKKQQQRRSVLRTVRHMTWVAKTIGQRWGCSRRDQTSLNRCCGGAVRTYWIMRSHCKELRKRSRNGRFTDMSRRWNSSQKTSRGGMEELQDLEETLPLKTSTGVGADDFHPGVSVDFSK